MRYLNTLDYSVIGAYFLILLVMGIYFQRVASRSLEDYFLGGKKLPWWALGISGMGSFIDMSGTMLIVSFLYMLGPRGLYIEFRGGAVLVLVFAMLWAGKWHRRSNCMTPAEWNIYRFGPGRWAQASRLITAVSKIVMTIGLLAYLIKGAGLFLSMFMPFPPLWCAALMVGLTVVYAMMSGFYGVVYTDMLQSFIILAAIVIIVVMAVGAVTGYEGSLDELARQVTGGENWTSTALSWDTPMPRGYEGYSALAMFAIFYVLKNTIDGMGWGDDPKYFGARSERECGLLTFFWTWLMMFRWPMMMGFAVLGLFLVRDLYPDAQLVADASRTIRNSPEIEAQFGETIGKNNWEDVIADITSRPELYRRLIGQLSGPELLGEDWQRRVQLVGFNDNVNPERILPAVILYRIPAGLRGLFVVALLAAAMSTFTPQVNAATAMFTRDMYQAFLRPSAGNRELIWASYLFGALISLAGFGMAARSANINAIWGWIIMGLGTGLVLPRFLRLYWWRYNAAGTVVGTFVGLWAAMVLLWVPSYLEQHGQPLWAQTLSDERWQFLLLMAITLVANVAGTFLTGPTERGALTHFYRTTRPFGFWGPLRASLPPEQRQKTDRENFYDILSIPFAMGWQITLFLLPMQLLIRNYRAFWMTFVIFAVCLAGLYIFWYRKLPAAEPAGDQRPGQADGDLLTAGQSSP